MRFGVLQFFSWPGRRVPLEAVYARALQRIETMDRTGYDAVWLAEHHFTDYSVCPSVHLMGMHVAARTRNLRIGTAVSLAPIYHPLRLAEEVAMLDVLTGGRVNWGAGRGFDVGEFKAFGVPVAESRERFREAVEIVLAAWSQERLNWHGKYWRFEDVEVLPKPAQKPHPPVWVAAGSADALDWAGEVGLDILLGPHADYAEIGAQLARYRAALGARGHAPEGRLLPITRFVACADSDSEAEAIARRGAAWVLDTYKNEAKGSPNPVASIEVDGRRRAVDPVERYLADVTVWGSPARIVDELQRLREQIGLDYLMCAPLSHASFGAFTEKVMPRLR